MQCSEDLGQDLETGCQKISILNIKFGMSYLSSESAIFFLNITSINRDYFL